MGQSFGGTSPHSVSRNNLAPIAAQAYCAEVLHRQVRDVNGAATIAFHAGTIRSAPPRDGSGGGVSEFISALSAVSPFGQCPCARYHS
jgi:hypothetical protein